MWRRGRRKEGASWQAIKGAFPLCFHSRPSLPSRVRDTPRKHTRRELRNREVCAKSANSGQHCFFPSLGLILLPLPLSERNIDDNFREGEKREQREHNTLLEEEERERVRFRFHCFYFFSCGIPSFFYSRVSEKEERGGGVRGRTSFLISPAAAEEEAQFFPFSSLLFLLENFFPPSHFSFPSHCVRKLQKKRVWCENQQVSKRWKAFSGSCAIDNLHI